MSGALIRNMPHDRQVRLTLHNESFEVTRGIDIGRRPARGNARGRNEDRADWCDVTALRATCVRDADR